MCYHNSISTNRQELESKYKKSIKNQTTLFEPIHHSSGFDFSPWPIVHAGSAQIESFEWGLIPFWANSPKDAKEIKAKTLNARIETIEEKAAFKQAKRCLVPSTGFFEWQHIDKQKIPYFIKLKNTEIFSLAGLYSCWINPNNEAVYTFSIITTEANTLMADIHNVKKRMPVILSAEQEEHWLDPKNNLFDFQKPFDASQMDAYTIDQKILSSNVNTPDVFLPKSISVSQQLGLF